MTPANDKFFIVIIVQDIFNNVDVKGKSMSFFSKKPSPNESSFYQRSPERIKKNEYIDVLYGVLDGLSVSCSVIKFLTDLFNPTFSAQKNYLFESYSERLALLACMGAISLGSMVANYPGAQTKPRLKPFAKTWQYSRDGFKSFKNTYKGLQGIDGILLFIGTQKINNIPTFLSLSILRSLSRITIRYYSDEQKKVLAAYSELNQQIHELNIKQKQNAAALLSEAERKKLLEEEKRLGLLKKLLEDATPLEIMQPRVMWPAFLIDNVLDNFYLYFRIITLSSSLSPPALMVMLVCSILYSVCALIVRVAEEHKNQQKLKIAFIKIKSALLCEELTKFKESLAEARGLGDVSQNLLSQNEKERLQEISLLLGQYYRNYCSSMASNYSSDILAGLKNGLAGYGTLVSVLMLAKQFFVFNISVGFIASGIGFIGVFIGFSLIYSYRTKNNKSFLNQSSSSLAVINEKFFSEPLNLEEIDKLIEISHLISNEPTTPSILNDMHSFLKDCIQLVSSFFSGLGKGSSVFNFIRNLLQIAQSPFIEGFVALTFAITLAARILLKEFKRVPSLNSNLKKDPHLNSNNNINNNDLNININNFNQVNLTKSSPQNSLPNTYYFREKSFVSMEENASKPTFFQNPKPSFSISDQEGGCKNEEIDLDDNLAFFH